jgi:hypothetical protein
MDVDRCEELAHEVLRLFRKAHAAVCACPVQKCGLRSARHQGWLRLISVRGWGTAWSEVISSLLQTRRSAWVGEQGCPKASATCCEHILWPVIDEADVGGPGVERVEGGEEDRRLELDDAEAAAEQAGAKGASQGSRSKLSSSSAGALDRTAAWRLEPRGGEDAGQDADGCGKPGDGRQRDGQAGGAGERADSGGTAEHACVPAEGHDGDGWGRLA